MRSLRSRSARLLAFVLIGALGCKAETFGEEDVPPLAEAKITVDPGETWPGATVALSSARFAQVPDVSALLRIEGHDAVAIRSGDTVFTVHLPTALGAGRHEFRLAFPHDTAMGVVTTYGYLNQTSAADLPVVNPQPWPWDAPTGVLAFSGTGTVRYVDAASGSAMDFPGLGSSYNGYAPGLSHRSRTTVLANGVVADLDHRTGLFTIDTAGPTSTRQVFELSEGAFLITTNHSAYSTGGAGSFSWQTESPWYLMMSPDGRYGTLIANTLQSTGIGDYALPIIDLASGGLARSFSGIGSTDAIAWAPDSRSIFLAARPHWGGLQRLLRIDAETGDTLAQTATEESWWGSGSTWGVAYDPQRELVYDLGWVGETWQLRVRHPATLELLGAADLPWDGCNFVTFPLLITDRGAGDLHAIMSGCGPTTIYHIRLPH